jgi:uroporphyrinogen III methyltransferase/synthase
MELLGKTILITRAASQSQELRAGLEQAGAGVIECPAIEIVPVEDWARVDQAVTAIHTYDLLIFTSVNAVDYFMDRVKAAGVDCSVPIAVVGMATAQRLERWRLSAAFIPKTFRAEGLLEILPADMTGKRVLLPRAETAREILPEELLRRGADVDVVTVYRTVKAADGLMDLPTILSSRKIDAVVLTSPSAVRFVAETLGEHLLPALQGIPIAVIGPVAAEAVEAAGLKAAIQPDRATVPDLVQKIRSFFSSQAANT